jgi:hypothetical protein
MDRTTNTFHLHRGRQPPADAWLLGWAAVEHRSTLGHRRVVEGRGPPMSGQSSPFGL